MHILTSSTLIHKLAKGLLAHRVRGRWSTTQENCFILIALRHYFDVYEKDEPDFNIHTWLGENYCVQQIFKGRSVDTVSHITTPAVIVCGRGVSCRVMSCSVGSFSLVSCRAVYCFVNDGLTLLIHYIFLFRIKFPSR